MGISADVNLEGVTWNEWRAAARALTVPGSRNHKKYYEAWRHGEDPTEYRVTAVVNDVHDLVTICLEPNGQGLLF